MKGSGRGFAVKTGRFGTFFILCGCCKGGSTRQIGGRPVDGGFAELRPRRCSAGCSVALGPAVHR